MVPGTIFNQANKMPAIPTNNKTFGLCAKNIAPENFFTPDQLNLLDRLKKHLTRLPDDETRYLSDEDIDDLDFDPPHSLTLLIDSEDKITGAELLMTSSHFTDAEDDELDQYAGTLIELAAKHLPSDYFITVTPDNYYMTKVNLPSGVTVTLITVRATITI